MNDAGIIDLYWQRSERAIPETETAYGAYCHTVAYSLLRNTEDAEESVNDTWLAAWNAMPPERPNSLKAFLSRITRNIAVTRLRRCRSRKRGAGEGNLVIDELSECLPGRDDPAQTVEARELLRCIEAFLTALPKRERVIFLGRYFYALSAEEIAARLGMKTAAVKSSLYRTRKYLLQKLKEEGM